MVIEDAKPFAVKDVNFTSFDDAVLMAGIPVAAKFTANGAMHGLIFLRHVVR